MTHLHAWMAALAAATITSVQALPPPFDPVAQAQAFERRVAALRPAAQAGDAAVQWELGQLLEGAGQAEALVWFRKAAAQQHDEALMHLADRLLNEADGREAAEALQWLRRAAARGHRAAQIRLGDALGFGFPGVTVDAAESQRWYREAALQGDPWAQQQLAQALRDGRGSPKDEPEAVRWFEKAARQGDALAQYSLAEMLQQGRGTARDDAAAAAWYARAAQSPAGPKFAAYPLARCYEFGRGVAQDFSQAAHWYEVGARVDDGRSQRKLSRLLRAGRGVAADPVQAYAWLTRAMAGDMRHHFDPEEMEELAATLSPAQREQGRQMAARWTPGGPMEPAGGAPVQPPGAKAP